MPQATYTLRRLSDVCGGDHICFLCSSNAERWRVLGEFYKKGLENNEQMMFFKNNLHEDTVLDGLQFFIPSIREVYARDQFQIINYTDVYFNDGKFDSKALVARLITKVDNSLVEGYSGLRACGDMSWVHNEDNLTKKLIHYESHLNHDYPTHYSAICMYDISAFKPNDMLQILSTHPQAIINEKLLHNIYYMPPDEYLGDDVSKAMLNRWMCNIEERRNIEEELIAAKMKAERAASAKAAFLATMSHEIRNPTNGIIGSADMLAHTKISEDQREFVGIIQAASKHLYKVVNEVLDFSKMEHDTLHLSYEPLLLSDLLRDSVRFCQYSIQKNLAVSLRYHSHPSCPPSIISDVTKLRQVLVNLVGNSCKFTEEGEVVVYVTPVDDPDLQVPRIALQRSKSETERKIIMEFSVTDTGPGIDPNDMGLLFQTFTKLASLRKWAGTGLGLAICKQLVESMGGTIRVTSEIGKGSTFSFRVPVLIPNDSSSLENSSNSVSLSPALSISPEFSPSASPSPSSCSSSASSPTPISSSSSCSSSPGFSSFSQNVASTRSSSFSFSSSSTVSSSSSPGFPFSKKVNSSRSSSFSSSPANASTKSSSSTFSSESSSCSKRSNPYSSSPASSLSLPFSPPTLISSPEDRHTPASSSDDKMTDESTTFSEPTTMDESTVNGRTYEDLYHNFPFSEPVPLSPSSSPRLSPSSPASLSTSALLASAYLSGSPSNQPSFSGSHVLVVEDDQMNQKVLSHMLRKLQFDVTIANNGLEAVQLVTHNNYTLIMTDQCMPVMDGVTAVGQIRNVMGQQGRECPPVVVCTGTVEPRLHDIMDAVLSKPVRFSTLVDVVSRFCPPNVS